MILTIATLITLAFVACDRDAPTQPVVRAGKATDDDCAFCDLFDAFNEVQEEEEDETPAEEAETDSTSSDSTPSSETPDEPPVAGSPATDRAALVAFYKATDGDFWGGGARENWLSDAPIREWYGITTDENGRVTKLRIDGEYLSGPIPPDLGNLDKLIQLHLIHNRLSGPIPPELGNLANLEGLYLSNNQLSGPIPPELGNLASLEVLALVDGRLSGEIPPELGNLASLKHELDLAANQLSGPIPPELGQLDSLRYLNLGVNQLSGSIPPEFGGLDSLEGLILIRNQLTGHIPPELGQLTNLRGLSLRENQLSGCIPRALLDIRSNDFRDLRPRLPFCDASAPEPVEPIAITADNSIDAELFQEASHEIQSSLEHLMPTVFSDHVLNGNEKTVKGVRGEVRLAKAYIVFSDYSITGEFTIAGTMWTGQPWGSGSNPNSPATGRVWVKEVDSDRRPFLIATKHELELGREGRQFKSIRSGLYVEAGAKYLATIKDDLIGAFKLALHTSLTKPNTYIDGIIPEGWSTGSGAFIYVEVERQRANWYFEFYCPAPAPKACASYALTDIRIKSNPVRIKGSLYVSRVQSKEEVEEDLRKGVGFGGYGVVYLDIGVDVAISDDKVEGTLTALNEAGRNTESDRSYTWTLEELAGEIQSYEYEIK